VKKFGAVIATEKDWTFRTANARADTGHVTLQTEIPAFTRVADHDVLVVADEAGEFGDYLEGRTALPRPVAGTSGWSPPAGAASTSNGARPSSSSASRNRPAGR